MSDTTASGKIILAPMEGVVDAYMREILTSVGGIDQCVTEFVRVSDRLLPAKVFHRLSPELKNGGKTSSGVPVVLQLLGSDPQAMAWNASRAAKLGAPAIDLNFGCPAKTVNKNRGGAVLLDTPNDIHDIVAAVRQAVPDQVPVTAKMRLGNRDKSLALENAAAIDSAGADGLVVHARTKLEGYKPPAHWEWIGRIRESVSMPVTANGEVWTVEDYHRCREASGCTDVMIGRGLVSCPDLGLQIKNDVVGDSQQLLDWEAIRLLIIEYYHQVTDHVEANYVHGRIKQWVNQMKRQYPQADELFGRIRTLRKPEEIFAALERACNRS